MPIKYDSTQKGLIPEDITGYKIPRAFEVENTAEVRPRLNYSMGDAAISVINGLSPISQIVYDVLDETKQKVESRSDYKDLNKGFTKEEYFKRSGASLDEADYFFNSVGSLADAEAWNAKRNFVLKAKEVARNSGYSGIVADLISSTVGDPVFTVSTVIPGVILGARTKAASELAAQKIVMSNYDITLHGKVVTESLLKAAPSSNKVSILKSTGEAIAGGYAFQIADEAMRTRLDPTRTEAESTSAIVTTTLLSGMLGAGFGTYRHLKQQGALKHVPADKPDSQVFDDMADDAARADRGGDVELNDGNLSAMSSGNEVRLTEENFTPSGGVIANKIAKVVAPISPRNRGIYSDDMDVRLAYADLYGRPTVLLKSDKAGVGAPDGVAEIQHASVMMIQPTSYEAEQTIDNLMKVKNIDRHAAETEYYIQAQSLGGVTEEGEQFLKTHISDEHGVINTSINQIKKMREAKTELGDLGIEFGDIKGYAYPVVTSKTNGLADQNGLYATLRADYREGLKEVKDKLKGGVASVENLKRAHINEYEFQIMQFGKQKGVDLSKPIPTESVVSEIKIPILPKELQKSNPRYGYKDKLFEVQFANDVDKALYIVAKDTESKAHAGFIKFLEDAGISKTDIKSMATKVRDNIKKIAAKQDHISEPKINLEAVFKVNMGAESKIASEKIGSKITNSTPIIDRGTALFKDDVEFQQLIQNLDLHLIQLKSALDTIDQSADDLASQTFTRWTGGMPGYAGFMGFGKMKDQPGFFMARKLDPVRYAPWLEKNPQVLNSYYFNQHGLAVGLKKKFGSHKPEEVFKNLRAGFDDKIKVLREAGDFEGATKLMNKVVSMEKDFTAAMEQMQGTFAKEFYQKYGTLASVMAAAKTMTGIAKLGNVVMGSTSELPAIFMTHQIKDVMPTVVNAIKFLSDPEQFKMAVKYRQSGGFALEVAMNDMQYAALTYGGGIQEALTKGENVLGFMRKWGQRLNGQVFYDHLSRVTAGLTQQTMFIENLEKMAAGKLSNFEMEQLAYMGISKNEAGKFLKGLEESIHKEQGLVFIDFNKIKNKDIMYRTQIALDRDLRRTFQQGRTGDIPHIMTHPVMSVITQFKSWPILATQNYAIPMMQRADAKTLGTFAMMAGVGSLVAILKESAQGRDTSKLDPTAVLYAGVEQSMGGLFSEVMNPIAGSIMKLNGITPIGGSRYYDKQTALEAFAGPSAGMLNDIFKGGYYGAQALGSASGLDVKDTSEQAARALMRVMPMNNFPILGNTFKEYLAPAGK
jgi:hypothetical protein